jgi:hypothetical protein
VYHLEMRQFPHVSRVFNLSGEDLERRFIRPWVAGSIIDHDDRRWAPERARLKVLEGPELRADELGMGRGWATATKQSRDVTNAIVAEARRGVEARPELESLKLAVEEVAVNTITLQDVMALAAAAQPAWRPSEQLALAEQAVWEMLHQGRVVLVSDGRPVAAERWRPIVLSWPAWASSAQQLTRPSA